MVAAGNTDGQGLNIVRNAHEINQGRLPMSCEQDRNASSNRDFFILNREAPEAALKTLLNVIGSRLPSLGFNPTEEVQVLTPMHGGALGTRSINSALQQHLNPSGITARTANRCFRVGDRVLQTRNDSDLDIYNGDIGFITSISGGHQEPSNENDTITIDSDPMIEVRFPQKSVKLSGQQLQDIELAYAISVHKSQGSEYPAVILLMHQSHYILLRRNLLYTAITRARRFCCVIGSEWAVGKAARELSGGERHTGLSTGACKCTTVTGSFRYN